MRFPYVRQTDSKHCGVACLTAICKYYGLSYSAQFISSLCKISAEGISLLGLADTAKKLGFETLSVSIGVEKLELCTLPVILHWNQNHYVVLYKIDRKRKRYYIADPAKGKISFDQNTFMNLWKGDKEKGIALLLEPDENFGKLKEPRDSKTSSGHIILHYLQKYKSSLVQLSLGLVLGIAFQAVLPFLTQNIVDIGINRKQINVIWLILCGELIIIVGKTASDFIRRWLLLHITMRVNITLVSDFFAKLLNLPMAFFDAKTIGDLSQRVGDHTRIQSFLTGQLINAVFLVLTLIVFSIILFIYSKLIFLVFISGSIVYALWLASFLKKRKILDYKLFEAEAINQSKTFQLLNAIEEIKLQNCKNRRRWDWEDNQAELFLINQQALKLQQAQEAGAIFINEIKNILVTILSATSVIDGNLTLGEMMAIQYIIGQLSSPVEQLMGIVYSYQDMRISLDRINEVHNHPPEEQDQGHQACFLHKKKDISLQNLKFKYDPYSPKQTIDDVTITIPEGKVTAIVGASGSGKTTLIKLIMGYYQDFTGEISIGGDSIRNYDLDWWREQCGVVLQEGYIFSESIGRNIAIGDDDIDWQRLVEASKIANIDSYIQTLPRKYDTIIGNEGAGLSQGQKQRILIARAIYKNPSYIFLDEATNSLDATNERTIVENLAKYYIGKTVVIVAHRLSTVRNADMIIVLDNGKIAETGNHSDLIERKGLYFQLVKNQLELGV